MNARDQQRYDRLRRIVLFLLTHLELKDAVDRSGVIPILQAFITEIERIDRGSQAVQLEAPGLTAERNALRRRLWEKVEAIGCASDIARREHAGMPSLHPAPFGNDNYALPTKARSVHAVAVKHREALLRAGLLPSLIDEILPLGELLEAIDSRRDYVARENSTHASRIPELIRTASQTVKLARRQFEPLMAPSLRAEWDAVVSLGRAHRPKALPHGDKPALGDGARRLLPRATARLAGESASPTMQPARKPGILRRLADLLRPSTSPHDADGEPDVQIEELKRLPAPADPQND